MAKPKGVKRQVVEGITGGLKDLYDTYSKPIVDEVMSALGRDADPEMVKKAVAQRAKPAPRARQKPIVRTDNPGGEWLASQRRRAEESRRPVSGAVTGYLKRPIELDPQKLAVIPGASGERRVPGDPGYDNLRPLVEAEGLYKDSPILVGVNHRGEPYIVEGNTRAAVARDLGIDRVPAEVRYFAGGEGVEGAMMPELLEKYMPASELSLDSNFRRFFGNSKATDEYGEPMRFYHATANDFSAFKPGGDDPELSGSAIWLSPYAASQPAFHNVGARGGGFREGARVLPLYARMQNPLVLDDPGMLEWARDVFAGGNSQFPYLMPKNWVDEIRSEGYDSVMYTPRGEGIEEHEYMVFEPTQLKSAIGNRGTYDPDDPDIRKARGGFAVKKGR